MGSTGKLYLIPVPVSGEAPLQHIPVHNIEIIKGLGYFIAEDAKTARKFLKQFGYPAISSASIHLLNEHTKDSEVTSLLEPLMNGHDAGLMSDAGCPGIADPGAEVVRLAHRKNIRVVPLSGPSAIVLSVMSSGFNGQNFAFIGYLPIDKIAKSKRLKELEQLALKTRQAQFFIETPYRNVQTFWEMLASLQPQTLVFVGMDITSASEMVVSRSVADWKKVSPPAMHKVPVVFGIFK